MRIFPSRGEGRVGHRAAIGRHALLTVLALAAIGAAGCGGGSDGDSEGGGDTASTAKSATLRVAYNTGISSIDPALACSSPYDYHIVTAAYDNIVELSPEKDDNGTNKVVGALAERWDVSEDQTTYTFHLRKDVKFASGNPMTSDDVVYSLNRLLDKGGCQAYVLTMGEDKFFRSIKALDAATVEVQIAHPDPLFLIRFSSRGNGPIDKKVLQANGGLTKAGDEWLARHVAGAGAYELASYEPDSEIRLKARANYWREAPKAKQVTMRVVTDPTTLKTLVQSGQTDLAFGVQLQDLAGLKSQGRQVFADPSNRYVFVGMNNKSGPTSDARVRKALWLATPHEEIAKRFGYGYVELFSGVIPPAMAPYYSDLPVPPQDLAQAKQLIADAGVGKLDLRLDVKSGETEQQQIATVLQAAWKELGVNLKVNTLGSSTYSDTVGNFKSQMYILRDGSSVNDPAFFLGFFLKCGNPFNWTQFCDERVDELMESARTEFDVEKRKADYAEISKIVDEKVPSIPIYATQTIAVANPKLQGYVYFPDQQVVLRNISVG